MVVLRCGLRSQAPGSNHQVIPTSIVMSFREVTNARALAQSLACSRCSINAGDKSEWKGSYVQQRKKNYSKTLLIMRSHAFYLTRLNILRSLMRTGCKNLGGKWRPSQSLVGAQPSFSFRGECGCVSASEHEAGAGCGRRRKGTGWTIWFQPFGSPASCF